MEDNLQPPESETIPSQTTTSLPKRNWVKLGILSTVAIILTGLIFYTGIWYARRNLIQPPLKNITPTENIIPVDERWQNRFVYDAFNYFYPSSEKPAKPDIRSINFNGTEERKHQILCEGKEVTFFWNVARFGKHLAFLLPSKEQEATNPDWENDFKGGKRPFTQGAIYLFDLEKNSCQSLGITADDLYNHQSMSFSPDGKYLAYVFYGLHLYDLSTKEDKELTKDEGSAHFGTIITGPLLWNSTASAVYAAISDGLGYPKGMSTSLYKIKINEIEEVSFPWSEQADVTSAKLAKREVVTKLADLYMDANGKSTWQNANTVPDNPLIYAVSPDENWIAFHQDRNLVVKNLKDASIKQVWEQRKNDKFPDEPNSTRLLSLTWARNNWIYFSTSCGGCGSGIGDIWGSLDGKMAEKLVRGENFITNTSGDKIAYNFDYFGIYYLVPGEPLPSGFRQGIDDAGHQYNGLGVYDIITKKDLKLSGKDKPSGFILR